MTMVRFAGMDQRYSAWVDDVLDIVREVGRSDEFILKSRVARLEGEVADRLRVRNAVACANGTGGLVLALKAMGIGPGDEVITPAYSFVSSASAIVLAGATPIFADVALDTFALEADDVERRVTARTRAVLPVHLFSQLAPMPAITQVATDHGLTVLEDSAVSLGADCSGRPAGTWGAAGVFSFYPAKPLGGPGDSGMVVTDDDELAGRVRALRNHGQSEERFRHDLIGYNCRMDEVVAGLLLRRLPHLDQQLEERRRIAAQYTAAFADLAPAVVAPDVPQHSAVYAYVVRVADRAALQQHLHEQGVESVAYYPVPLHLQRAFAPSGHRVGDFPRAELLASQCLALPLHPELPAADVDRVVAAVTGYARARVSG